MSDLSVVSLYNLVHGIVYDTQLGASIDRRSNRRRPFRCVQRVAPCAPGRFPAPTAFVNVSCEDLSPGGFSYLADEPPDYETLIVELGVQPDVHYLTALVASVSELWDRSNPRFRVGCRFTGRADVRGAAAAVRGAGTIDGRDH